MNRRKFVLSSVSAALAAAFPLRALAKGKGLFGGPNVRIGKGPLKNFVPREGKPLPAPSPSTRNASIPDAILRQAGSARKPSGPFGYAVGDVIPEFSAPDQFGVTRSIRDYTGQYVLVDFTPLWCDPCAVMASYAAGVRHTLRSAGVPFEYVSIILTGAHPQSTSSTRGEAETWAFGVGETSPCLSNAYVYEDPSTHALVDAFLGFVAVTGQAIFPTIAILGPDQRVLHVSAGGWFGQELLDLFTELGISPPLVAPPAFRSPIDTMRLGVTAGDTQLSTEVGIDSGYLSDLGGLGLYGGARNPRTLAADGFIALEGDGTPYKYLQVDVMTLHPITGVPDYLPLDIPFSIDFSDFQTLRFGAARPVGVSLGEGQFDPFGQGVGQNILGFNDPLFPDFLSYTNPLGNPSLDHGQADISHFLTTAAWFDFLGQYGLEGPPWRIALGVPLRLVPPGVRIDDMIAGLPYLSSSSGVRKSLATLLQSAIKAMGKGSGCQAMKAFDAQLKGFQAAGKLDAYWADQLAQQSLSVAAQLGC